MLRSARPARAQHIDLGVSLHCLFSSLPQRRGRVQRLRHLLQRAPVPLSLSPLSAWGRSCPARHSSSPQAPPGCFSQLAMTNRAHGRLQEAAAGQGSPACPCGAEPPKFSAGQLTGALQQGSMRLIHHQLTWTGNKKSNLPSISLMQWAFLVKPSAPSFFAIRVATVRLVFICFWASLELPGHSFRPNQIIQSPLSLGTECSWAALLLPCPVVVQHRRGRGTSVGAEGAVP